MKQETDDAYQERKDRKNNPECIHRELEEDLDDRRAVRADQKEGFLWLFPRLLLCSGHATELWRPSYKTSIFRESSLRTEISRRIVQMRKNI